MRAYRVSALGLMLALATPVMAQSAGAGCPKPVAPPSELAAWITPPAMITAGTHAAAAPIVPGQHVIATLAPGSDVHFPVTPGREGTGNGGLLAITIAKAGTYRVALGSGAWVDLTSGGKAIESVAHGHGPKCTGVAKMVDFKLTPGTYGIQFASSANPTVELLVALVP